MWKWAILTLIGCSPFNGVDTFNCLDDEQCGVTGRCQPNGFCSFDDSSCSSGQRYGTLSGSLAGTCVDPDVTTDGPQAGIDGSIDAPTGTQSVTLSAGAAVSEVDAILPSDVGWGAPGNATSDDDVDTSATNFDSDEGTHRLRSHTYGFAIPAGATIVGIEVVVEILAARTTCRDDRAQLFVGGASAGINQPNTNDWPAARTLRTYGGPVDLWGATWTPADINSATFGFGLKANTVQNGNTARVDHHRITVYFLP